MPHYSISSWTRAAIGYAGRLAIALAAVLSLAQAGEAPATQKLEFLEGKVVPLAGLLEKLGAHLDPEAAPHWFALVTKDGAIYPLIQDDGAQPFFADPRLRDRPMRLGGRRFKDTQLFQVLSINSIVKGKRCEVYYWCDICAIRRDQKPPRCDCCGGPMALREVPLEK